jgi:hypothetical protein
MIEKVMKKRTLGEYSEIREDLEYWLSKSSEERVSAVEILRRQRHGDSLRLERVARVVQRRRR